ncbi:MAG: FAD-dependent oxidoreductase [Bacteroidales bacterium]|jgi:NADPH-dependent 2,4-dienoyl-CoA reductase/sulfur reductase-like enzyme|nr:FAD-dependent oxidoreductase [Bacteroidales bacterium]HOL97632.1 FAD-dependent oxidoreductase [Bacteroidales bacterium]HOM37467.1 FAD-dependent oxidoreductase [Bacteroidales bacterium]HPD24368.1 FAD-dependent oxidoreductase [Bacteroidales bacterium]HRT00242.1 FAD-dependent oxidoreductase [Bacteroidales bacterium]
MKNTDVLVIGGSAAGMVAALTGKSSWSDKSFILIKKQKDVMVPCGIPYIFGTLNSSQLNIMPVDNMLAKAGIESIVNEVVSIDKNTKIAKLISGEEIKYDKLVIATGSIPIVPKWLKGTNLENFFVIPKDKTYLDEMKSKISGLKKVVVIGAGFIGVEVSDELAKSGHDVTLIEKEKTILASAFDEEVASKIEEIIKNRGIKLITGNGVKEIIGNTKVEKVKLENDTILDADAVILSMGYQPNTELAKKSGIYLDESNYIVVDEYMRTHEKDIFAVGDCAQKRDFITRKRVPTMLASTACAEARVCGMNLFGINIVKTFSGTISIYSTAIDGHGFGTAGITERRAKEEGINIVSAIFEGVDRHPGNMPDTKKQIVKLIVAKQSGVIVGGEVIGGLSAGELTNVIGIIIQNRMTISTLLTSQIGTHPCLTASPAAYPIIKAAEMVAAKIKF